MDMRNDSQSPCSNRYQRGMEQRERNRKRRRNARLKRILKEAAVCISVAALTAGGLLYMILNDPYEAPAAPIERTYWNGQQYTQEEYESMMSEREAYLQQEGMAVYVCQECGCKITDQDRDNMIRYGEWREVRRNTKASKKVAFWINTLYSPFVRFSEIVKEFLDSKDNPDLLQNFVNSWLAEPWEDTKLKTDADMVMERQTDLPQLVVPSWARYLTAGVDVQETCLYWTIRAWGPYITSQNIAHGQALSFQDIESTMNTPYLTESGEQVIVSLCLIDSGYDADSTYDFCATNSEWAMPVKGASNPMMSHFKTSKINKVDSKAYGMNLVLVDGDKYKDMIASRMRKDNGKGAWMVYEGCDREYAEQVTSEHKVNEKSGSRVVQRWRPKHSHIDNHYLDCEVYSLAAADILGVRMLHLQVEAERKEQLQRQQEEQQETPEENWIRANEHWV